MGNIGAGWGCGVSRPRVTGDGGPGCGRVNRTLAVGLPCTHLIDLNLEVLILDPRCP